MRQYILSVRHSMCEEIIEYYAALCTAYVELGEYEKSTEHGERALKLGLETPIDKIELYISLAKSYHELKKSTEGNMYFDNALCLIAESDISAEKSIEFINEILDYDCFYYDAQQMKGEILLETYRIKEAIECFEAAAQLSGGPGAPYAGLGKAYLSWKDYEKSIKNFELAVQEELSLRERRECLIKMSTAFIHRKKGDKLENLKKAYSCLEEAGEECV